MQSKWNIPKISMLLKYGLIIGIVILILVDINLRMNLIGYLWISPSWIQISIILIIGILLFPMIRLGFHLLLTEDELIYFFETQDFYMRGKNPSQSLRYILEYMLLTPFVQEFLFRFALPYWGIAWVYSNLIFAFSHLVAIFLYREYPKIAVCYVLSALFLGFWLTYIYYSIGLLIAILLHGVFVLILYYSLEREMTK